MKQVDAVNTVRIAASYARENDAVNAQAQMVADIIKCLWPGDWERAVRHLKAHGKSEVTE